MAHGVYAWLEMHGLWEAVILWAVGTILGAVLAWRPWKSHRKAQEELLDRLDVRTPGGLRDIALLLKRMNDLLEPDQEDE